MFCIYTFFFIFGFSFRSPKRDEISNYMSTSHQFRIAEDDPGDYEREQKAPLTLFFEQNRLYREFKIREGLNLKEKGEKKIFCVNWIRYGGKQTVFDQLDNWQLTVAANFPKVDLTFVGTVAFHRCYLSKSYVIHLSFEN